MLPTHEDVVAGRTLAEIQGFPAELGAAVLRLARHEMEAGDPGLAREILEGLVVTNPRDALAWALLSQVVRRDGEPCAALLLAEAAWRLDPQDRQVRLVRAEALLAVPAAGEGAVLARRAARDELRALSEGDDAVSRRAGALRGALGP